MNCKKCGVISVAETCDKCREAASVKRVEAIKGKGLCPICNRVPKQRDSRYCRECGELVANNRARGNRPDWMAAFRIIVWRGYGVYTVQSGNGLYVTKPLPPSAIEKLPKTGDKVIRLDGYCQGYDGATIHQLKKSIMKAHNLKREPARV